MKNKFQIISLSILRVFFLFIIIFLVLYLAIFKIKFLEKNPHLSGTSLEKASEINLEIKNEARLDIPKIALKAPIIWSEKENEEEIIEELKQGVVHLKGSARPGERGSQILIGHSSVFPEAGGEYDQVFARLDELKINDEIFISYQGKKYKYQVLQQKIIGRNEVKELDKIKEPVLFLVTCWPRGTDWKRLVIEAR